MNYNVFPSFPRDHRNIPYWQTEDEHPVYAKDQRDVPDWLRAYHLWEPASDVNKLQKLQLKVKMCCSKCEEIVVEKIREVRGVFDVRAEHRERKVVVVIMPCGVDEHEVLRKARTVHKRARFVELDAKEKQAQQKPKGDDKGGQGGHGNQQQHQQQQQGGGGKNKEKKEMQAVPAHSISGFSSIPWGLPTFWPIQTCVPRYLYVPPGHVQLFPDPHGRYVSFI